MKHVILSIGLLSGIGKAASTDLLHTYWWANYQTFGNKYDDAHYWYTKLLKANPPIQVHKGYSNFLAQTGQFATLIARIPELDNAFAQDIEMQLLFATILSQHGFSQDADQRFLQLNTIHKHHDAIAFQAANIYLQRKEPENALATIDHVLHSPSKGPSHFVFHFLKAQIFMQMHQPDQALAAVAECLRLQPNFDKGLLLQALLHEQLGHIPEAIQGFSTYLARVGNQHPDIKKHLQQLTLQQKVAASLSAPAITTPPLVRIGQLLEAKNYHAALTLIEEQLRTNPGNNNLKAVKIDALLGLGRYNQVAQLLTQLIDATYKEPQWFAVLHAACRKGLSYQKALTALETILERHPGHLQTILYLADINTRAHRYHRALEYHTKALELVTDAHIKTKVCFTMALIYYDQGKEDAMEKILEQGYRLGKDFPPLLNMLAYHYVFHHKQLTQAQELITRALAASPSNHHFIDTQALLLYTQKEYTKALALLEPLEGRNGAHDASLLRTLSKIHYELGHKQQAITTMKQALHLTPTEHDKKICSNFLCQWEAHS